MHNIRTFFTLVAILSSVLPFIYGNTEHRLVSYIITMIMIILACVIQLSFFQTRRIVKIITQKSLHIIIFFAFFLISQLLSININNGPINIMDFVWTVGYIVIGTITYLVFPVSIAISSFKAFIKLMMFIGVSSSIIALIVAVSGARSILFWEISQVSYYSTFGVYFSSSIFYTANRFAFVAFFGCVSALYLLSKREHIVIALVSLLVCIAGIALSWSRALYISLFICIGIWTFFNIKKKYQPVIFLSLVALILLVIGLILSNDSLYTVLYAQGWARRDVIWPAAMNAISKHPWWGYGISSGDAVKEIIYNYTGRDDAIHNTLMSLAFRTGIPSVFLWIGVLWLSFSRLIRSTIEQAKKTILSAGIIGAFFAALFSDYSIGGLGYGSVIFTIFLGLANLAIVLSPKENTVKNRCPLFYRTYSIHKREAY